MVRPGPPVLRDHDYPYGFPKGQAAQRRLKQDDFNKIREDNLLAERTAEACEYMRLQGSIYAVEQPFPWQGSVSMFDLEPFKKLRRKGGDVVVFDQCCYSAPTKKPTQILYQGARFDQLEAVCNHEAVRQVDERGRKYYAAHPSAVRQQNPDGSYKTKALAAYPPDLNKQIARIIADAIRDRQWGQQPS